MLESRRPEEVLTAKEVAAWLELAERTVYARARAGDMPAFKVRGPRRIRRAEFELHQWMDAEVRGGESGGGDDDGR